MHCLVWGHSSFFSVKHKAAEFEKSLKNPSSSRESRRTLSVLLGREWRFARWMLGNAVLNLFLRSSTGELARFPRLCVLKRPELRPCQLQCPTKRLNNQYPVKDNWCVLPNVQQLIPGKLIMFEKQKTGKLTKTKSF